MASLFRGSARQAERLRKALTVPDLADMALSLPAKPTTLYLKIGALSRKLSLQREGANTVYIGFIKIARSRINHGQVDDTVYPSRLLIRISRVNPRL